MQNLIQVLHEHALRIGDVEAVAFLDGENRLALTYAELDARSRGVAALLQEAGAAPGARVLLLLPPGLDFVVGFYGCLRAGMIAIPVPPPSRAGFVRSAARVSAIAKNCSARFALTAAASSASGEATTSDAALADCQPIRIDNVVSLGASEWRDPEVTANSTAFLQYTSGSTGSPKGVVVTHGNLIANSAQIRDAFGHTSADRGVIWLPPYHDMGLIGGIIQPIYVGFPVVLMPPKAFVLRPFRWLDTISRERGTVSGGPDFCYELALGIPPGEIAELDLSCWRVAFTGAEPVRASVIERFTRTFECTGFRRRAFLPVYGLAESTLLVSVGKPDAEPILTRCDVEELEQGRVVATENSDGRVLVGCGSPREQLEIVSPDSGNPCLEATVGEIWLRGPSVADSYLGLPEETRAVFRAELATAGTQRYFLRTGDLGFVLRGELFVSGRLKDMIIIRGRNLAPQDIEADVVGSHRAVARGGAVAFPIEHDGRETLAIVAEVSLELASDEPSAIAACIARAVGAAHDVAVERVVLVKPRTIPRTPSGKLRRGATRAEFLRGALPTLAQIRPDEVSVARPNSRVQAELVRIWTAVLGREVGVADNFFDLGGDSVRSVQAQALAAESGICFELHELLEHPTITELGALARLRPKQEPAAPRDQATTYASAAQVEIVLRELASARRPQ